MKTVKIGHLVLGVDVLWKVIAFGVILDYSPHPWRPYLEFNLGPFGVFFAWDRT